MSGTGSTVGMRGCRLHACVLWLLVAASVCNAFVVLPSGPGLAGHAQRLPSPQRLPAPRLAGHAQRLPSPQRLPAPRLAGHAQRLPSKQRLPAPGAMRLRERAHDAHGQGGTGGCGGGRWWRRHHHGSGAEGPDGMDRAGKRSLLQGLLALRGGDVWLSAYGKQGGRQKSPAVEALLCINIVIFILQLLTRGWLLEAGAKINGMIVMGEFYRLLTPVFLHGGVIHLLVNSLSLNAVGPTVEMLFGTDRMVFTYVVAGIGGNCASFLFSPQAMSVGASGAIFGLVGALAVHLVRHKHLYGERSDRMLNAIMQTCVLNLCIGLLPGSRIDNWGHFGGAAVGAITAFLVGPNLRRERGWIVDRPLVPLFSH